MSNVSRIRRFKGMTQKEVADILGISLQWYWQKEKGNKPFNDEEKLILLKLFKADFKDLTIDSLFFKQEVSKVERCD